MKKRMIFVAVFMTYSSLYAQETRGTAADINSSISEQELQKAIALEKKYAKEQKFYDAKTYDFKGAEINKKSLKHIEVIEPDDPDLDSDAILGMSEEEGLTW